VSAHVPDASSPTRAYIARWPPLHRCRIHIDHTSPIAWECYRHVRWRAVVPVTQRCDPGHTEWSASSANGLVWPCPLHLLCRQKA